MKTDENSLAAQVAAKLNLRMEWQLLGKLLFLIFAMTQSESNSLSTDLRLVSRICISADITGYKLLMLQSQSGWIGAFKLLHCI